VDYRDAAGIRRWTTCDSKGAAENVLADKIRDGRQRRRPAVDPEIVVDAYADRWLGMARATLKSSSTASYETLYRVHVRPRLGGVKVRHLSRGQLRAFLAERRTAGLSRARVNGILSVLRLLLQAAVDDGVLLANPAAKLGRQLRLELSPVARQEQIKAMTRAQLAQFLDTAARVDRRHVALWFTMARAGLRSGEAFALWWEDLDFAAREMRIARSLGPRGEVSTPKSGHARTVDMSRELAGVLRRLQTERKADALRRGRGELPPWVFANREGGPLNRLVAERAFKRVLNAAGLPLHFTPHCLRHSYASQLLQAGAPPLYVKRQLGHHSIKLTVDTYGRWLPVGDRGLVDRLDQAASGSKVVAAGRGSIPQSPDSQAELGPTPLKVSGLW
jgi:integrase